VIHFFILGLKPPQNMTNNQSNPKNRKSKKVVLNEHWEKIHPHAAGLDIGAREIFVCVPSDRDCQAVRLFGTKTPDLEALAYQF
jgi:hypothetical protein